MSGRTINILVLEGDGIGLLFRAWKQRLARLGSLYTEKY